MKRWMLVVLILVSGLIIAATVVFIVIQVTSRPLISEQAEDRLKTLLSDKLARDSSLRNAVLLVDAPTLGINGVWAAGVADEADGTAMTPETPYLSASVGKLFTAATVLALAQENVLSLDDSIVEWLSPDIYRGIPVAGGDESLAAVTIRMLLGHRSGIPDYYEGDTVDGSPNVRELLVSEPDRVWTPELLLDYVKTHMEPAGSPGAQFVYSDTNYDLLGMIVEEATGEPFHEVVEERVLAPLDLEHTWYHARTDASRDGPPFPTDPMYADVWIRDVNMAGVPALSLDWAGGGLATTTADLRSFMRSLLADTPVALDVFHEEWSENAFNAGIDYGYGLWRIRPEGLFFLLRGYPELYGVSGSTGTYLYYVPKYDAVIAGAFNQTGYQQSHIRFLIQILAVLNRIET